MPDAVGSAKLLKALRGSAAARRRLGVRPAEPVALSNVDGLRVTLADGSIVHAHASGNTQELRCYVETASNPQTETLLAGTMDALSAWLSSEGNRAP